MNFLYLLKTSLFWCLSIHLLVAHLLSDFYFQSDSWIRNKSFLNRSTYYHFLIVFFSSALISFDKNFLPYAFLLAVIRVLIDFAKKVVEEHLWQFALDQLMHVVSIVTVVLLFLEENGCKQFGSGFVPIHCRLIIASFVCAFLACMTPANYIVRAILEYYSLYNGECNKSDSKLASGERTKYSTLSISLKHSSGALIGSLERILVFLFIIVGSYQSAGFIVAAKSLLRFRDNEGERTALVVAGTLLSVIIAVGCAMVFKFVVLNPQKLKVLADHLSCALP